MSILKLTSILMMCLVFNANAKILSQNKTVSLNFEQEKLKNVFSEIKRQTSYDFCYSENYLDVNKKVDAKFQNEKLSRVLNCLLGDLYSFRYESNFIVITPKDKEDKKDKVVKGVVLDLKNKPLPGVTVVVKGTSVGVATDNKGQFEIKSKVGDILIISFIGMESQEVKIKDLKKIKVVLKEKAKALDEVVITGYQTIEKRKLTSSVVTVKGKDVVESIGTSIDQMLQGKIPGMTVMNQSSTPGASTKIRIRGSSSITGNREPVWVVDGVILDDPVPISPEELNSMDNINFIGNAISFLNPEDIERIDVLKDASATAIYGVKAANGVIVVTTKKGATGKAKVNYTTSFSMVGKPTYDLMHRMNSEERIEVSEEMQRRGMFFSSMNPSRVSYEGALMDYWDRKISYSDFRQRVKKLKENNTNWYDNLFRDAISQSHNLSISGSTDETNYYFSAGVSDQKGATLGVDYKRYNVLVKVSTNLRKNLKVGLNLNSSLTKNKRPHSSVDLYKYAYETSRAIPLYNEDGSLSFYFQKASFDPFDIDKDYEPIQYNVLHELDHTGQEIKNSMVSATFNLDWNVKDWLKFSVVFNGNRTTSKTESWVDEKSFYAQCKRTIPYGEEAPPEGTRDFFDKNLLPGGGQIDLTNSNRINYMFRSTLSFHKGFNSHFIGANLGYEVKSSKIDMVKSTCYGYLPERGKKFISADLGLYTGYAEVLNKNFFRITDAKNNFMSYYGTFTYAYNNKYILNFNLRADGSNKFGQDKSTRFLPIWSLSGKWNIYKESIFDNQNFINDLSIRASYGIQGNVSEDQIPNLILNMGSKNIFANEYYSNIDKVPNSNLKWEKTKSYNLGIDFSFLKGKLNGTVELYKKIGEDQIIRKTISSTNGAQHVSINEGNIENKGWEISLSSNIINTKNWQWGLTFNTSKNYNKITDAGSPKDITHLDYINGTIISDGRSVNSFYSYKYNCLDKDGYPTFFDYAEKDEEGNYVFTSVEDAYSKVFVYSGKREPDLCGGFSTFLRYKDFSVNGAFSFNLGQKIRLNKLYKASGQSLPFPQQNMSDDFIHRWKKPGDEAITDIPTLSSQNLEVNNKRKYVVSSNIWQMYDNSDLRVVDGSFLRCRNLTLNYNLKSELIRKMSFNNIRLSLGVSNLFVIKSKKLKGRDPEQIELGSGSIPPQKTYSIRLTANF